MVRIIDCHLILDLCDKIIHTVGGDRWQVRPEVPEVVGEHRLLPAPRDALGVDGARRVQKCAVRSRCSVDPLAANI